MNVALSVSYHHLKSNNLSKHVNRIANFNNAYFFLYAREKKPILSRQAREALKLFRLFIFRLVNIYKSPQQQQPAMRWKICCCQLELSGSYTCECALAPHVRLHASRQRRRRRCHGGSAAINAKNNREKCARQRFFPDLFSRSMRFANVYTLRLLFFAYKSRLSN